MVLVLATSGCTGDDGTATAPVPTTSASVTPSRAPSPTPTVVPTATAPALADGSDPDVGMFFTALPDVTGDEARAAETLMRFEVEFWRSMTTGAVSSALDDVASADVVQIVRNQVEGNKDRKITTSGSASDAFVDVNSGTKTVVIDVCNTMDDAVFTKGTKKTTGPEAGFDPAIVRMEVGETPKGWRVQSYTVRDAC
ncbi:hypothetical protein [Cellulomonas rhizosphaerae]|uniref:hypothetical protein n=1 Tax=Cellulomonas rhizosphaerae TaxID=2293719 RepID=UPI0010FEF389|nr:hypothetical protein [Cellulomonas rhizosphaerae]